MANNGSHRSDSRRVYRHRDDRRRDGHRRDDHHQYDFYSVLSVGGRPRRMRSLT